jgi:hypothetical protein
MSEPEKKLQPEEAKRLADIAMHTSFNWVVMFLAFIAGLVGLLQVAKPYESNLGWWAFSILLFIAYSALSFGLSYSIYATFHTRFLIIYLRNLYETPSVKSFLNEYWSRFYTPLIVHRNDKVLFRKRLAIFLSVLAGIVSILLLLFLFLVKS